MYAENHPLQAYEGKAKICYEYQNFLSIFNPLGLCKFLFCARTGHKMISAWMNKNFGWDMDMEELMKTGERLVNLKRMIDVKLEISKKDDIFPKHLLEPKPDGSAKGMVPPVDIIKRILYSPGMG